MQLKVRLKFNETQRVAILDFCEQLDMQVEEFCKRAVIYAMNDSYNRARKMQEEQNNGNDALRGESERDNEAGLQPQSDVNPDTLAHTSDDVGSVTEGSGPV